MFAAFKPLLFIVVAASTFESCRPRQAANLNTTVEDANVAWFTGGDRPIKVYVSMSPEAVAEFKFAGGEDASRAEWETIFAAAYTRWIFYLSRKGIQPLFRMRDIHARPDYPKTAREPLAPPKGSPSTVNVLNAGIYPGMPQVSSDNLYPLIDLADSTGPHTTADELQHERGASQSEILLAGQTVEYKQAFPVALKFVEDAKTADLEVHIGTTPSFLGEASVTTETTVRGYVALDNRETSPIWRRGALVVQGTASDLASVVMSHELGHIFGNPHVPGTVMDADEIGRQEAFIKDEENLDIPFAIFYLIDAPIDRWRHLALCQRSDCKISGQSFGFLDSSLNYDFMSGKISQVFRYNLKAAPIEEKLNEKETLVDEKHYEIFKRPAEVGAKRFFHESKVFRRWLHNNVLTNISINANSKDTSPIRVVADCKGYQLDYFRSSTYDIVNHWYVRTPWTPINFDRTKPAVESYVKCGGDKRLTEAIPNYEKAWPAELYETAASPSGLTFEDASTELLSGNDVNDIEKVGISRWCGSISAKSRFCIIKSGTLYAMKIFGESTSSHELKLYNPEDLPSDGRLKMGWRGDFWSPLRAGRKGFPIYFRVGVTDDIGTNPEKTSFELDIESRGVVWRKVARGELLKTPTPVKDRN